MGHPVLHVGEVESTNSYAVERFGGLPHGVTVVADRQTRGRGRLDRGWHSSIPGNLYASLVLKTPADQAGRPPRGFANLTQYMAVVLARVVEARGAPVSIKWPNDLLSGNRKLAGILAQAVGSGGRVEGAVLGAGVNLAMTAVDLDAIDQPATSLNMLLGRPVDRDGFLEAVLTEFWGGYEGLLAGGFPVIRGEYLARTPFLGRAISVHSLDSRIDGTACDITDEGNLEVLTPQGRVQLSVGDLQ